MRDRLVCDLTDDIYTLCPGIGGYIYENISQNIFSYIHVTVAPPITKDFAESPSASIR